MEVRRLGSYPTSGKLRASAASRIPGIVATASFTHFWLYIYFQIVSIESKLVTAFFTSTRFLRTLNVIMGSTSPTRGPASALFTPLSIANGTITLKHRIIMSPMTRNRCIPLSQTNTPESPNRVWIPDELVAKYYGQRATKGGLIVTESILPNAEAGAMPGVPGLWLPEHLAGWKLVCLFPLPLIPLFQLCQYFNKATKSSLRSHKQSTPKAGLSMRN
jgi:hypothetical protein